ncbi:transcription termination factor MTERF8, chloroplastic-like [Carex rostrata]
MWRRTGDQTLTSYNSSASLSKTSHVSLQATLLIRVNLVRKIDFFIGVLESVDNLSVILKSTMYSSLLRNSLEKAIIPNISFLREQCGSSPRQITRLLKSVPRLISSSPDYFHMQVERVEKLGIARSSANCVHGLLAVSYQKQCTIDSKLDNLTSLGISQEEVAHMISKTPKLLGFREKLVRRKMEYLIKEAGCDKIDVVQNPVLLMYSYGSWDKDWYGEIGLVLKQNGFPVWYKTSHVKACCLIHAEAVALLEAIKLEEVSILISEAPNVLALPEKLVGSKMEYLIKEAGCDKIDVLGNPVLLTYSLENRLIPRNIVRKLLMSKGLAVANNKFVTFMKPSEEEFVKKYVMPYEIAIPGLHQAYADASPRKIADVE